MRPGLRNLFLAICLLASLALTACATTKTLQPINGSKADGTVTLAYEYNIFEKPVLDWNLASATARKRCAAWGFRDAEAFGGTQSNCLAYNGYGNCIELQVNVIYQCTK